MKYRYYWFATTLFSSKVSCLKDLCFLVTGKKVLRSDTMPLLAVYLLPLLGRFGGKIKENNTYAGINNFYTKKVLIQCVSTGKLFFFLLPQIPG